MEKARCCHRQAAIAAEAVEKQCCCCGKESESTSKGKDGDSNGTDNAFE